VQAIGQMATQTIYFIYVADLKPLTAKSPAQRGYSQNYQPQWKTCTFL
jgi:hypothetical protein